MEHEINSDSPDPTNSYIGSDKSRDLNFDLLSNNKRQFILTDMYKCFISLPIFTWLRWKTELKILWKHKGLAVLCLLIQLLHSPMTNIAYLRHKQGVRLKDIGFELIPELPDQWKILSEYPGHILLASLVILILVSLCQKKPRGHMMTILLRTFVALSAAVIFRCLTFLSTSLPGPAIHCQPGSTVYNPPKTIADIFLRTEATTGCGDLIFSGHTSGSLCTLLSFYVYAPELLSRRLARILFYGLLLPIFCALPFLIIAARNHYTVDVVVAMYVTPMLYYSTYCIFPKFSEFDSSQDKKTKEEYIHCL